MDGISMLPSKRSRTDRENGSTSQNKRHCSGEDIVVVDLTTGSSPPTSQLIATSPSVARPSSVLQPPIASIFLRQNSRHVEPGLKDVSGYTPLTFCMPRGTSSRWWTHELYRGPGGRRVKVEYCKTKEEMERVARTYLEEPIVGFDMEWWSKAGGIKGNISLIQVGVEDRIALFHIAMFKGDTINDLVSPSLRKLIECPQIIKAGSAVYAADGLRLKRFMHLKPRGFLELGHLYRVVMFANTKPALVTNAGWALAKQVKEHFGIPMSKGPVRSSNWTQPLTPQQVVYAASDAYAGYMLYRVMELKRIAMTPTPPKPAFAELFLKVRATVDQEITSVPVRTVHAIQQPELVASSLDTLQDRMYEALRIRRKWFAKKEDIPAYAVALNTTLAALVETKPTSMADLAKVQGITQEHIGKYGSEWLRIIRSFVLDASNQVSTQSSATITASSVMSKDDPRHIFKKPICVTPSPPSSFEAVNKAVTAGQELPKTAAAVIQDSNSKRALSALQALRIRLSMSNNLTRDFVSDEFLHQFACSYTMTAAVHTARKNTTTAEAVAFYRALEICDIDVEQFMKKHAPLALEQRMSMNTKQHEDTIPMYQQKNVLHASGTC